MAAALGHHAFGIDRDPLAVILAQAWCAKVTEESVKKHAQRALDDAIQVAAMMPEDCAYPSLADEETRAYIRYWYDEENRIQLKALADQLVRIRDRQVRAVLWTAFSRMIITKDRGVSLAVDVSHSRPHRVRDHAPNRVFDVFESTALQVAKALPFPKESDAILAPQIRKGDARRIGIQSESMDIIVTSPPYLNAIDYLRGHKLSLVWMGYPVTRVSAIRSSNVGTEKGSRRAPRTGPIAELLDKAGQVRHLPLRIQRMLVKYIRDMRKVAGEIARILKPGGEAMLIVGDSTVKGTFVANSVVIRELLKTRGLRLISSRRRCLPENRRYLPPPTNSRAGASLQGRMREEVILSFRK